MAHVCMSHLLCKRQGRLRRDGRHPCGPAYLVGARQCLPVPAYPPRSRHALAELVGPYLKRSVVLVDVLVSW